MAVINNANSSTYKLDYQYSSSYLPQYDDYEYKSLNKNNNSKKRSEEKSTVAPRIIAWILILFIALFFVVFRYVEINESSNLLNQYKAEYNKLKSENEHIQLAIDRSVDLNYIEEVAKNKLGMQKPTKSQIVYININNTDYAEIPFKTAKIKEKKGMLSIIISKITNVMEYLQ